MTDNESIRGNTVEIDYTSTTDDNLVIRTTAGIAVYTNHNGDIVIRQDGGFSEDDAIIIVSRCDVDRLAHALQS